MKKRYYDKMRKCIDSAASNCHAYNYYFKQNLHFVAW